MSISIVFHRRPSSCGAMFLGSVFVRVICQRQQHGFTLPWRVYPEEWDNERHCVLPDQARPGREVYLRQAAAELKATSNWLWEEAFRLKAEGSLTAEKLVTRYKSLHSGCRLKSWSEELATELEDENQPRTARAYRTAVKRLLGFAESDDLELKQLTADRLLSFENFLRKEEKSDNTISFYMRMLRAIYNKAVDRDLIPQPPRCPFSGVYTSIPETPKRALATDEIQTLAAVDYTDEESPLPPSERMACAVFLFCFWAHGMSFVDAAFLRKSDIRDGMIRYRRRKSGAPLQVPLSEELQALISWFAPLTEGSPYVLPLIRRPGAGEYLQYQSALRLQNKRLKRLAALVESGKLKVESENPEVETPKNFQFSTFNFQLSSHSARHSWATMAKQLLVPLSQIREGLGHRSEKTTLIYLASFEAAVWEGIDRKMRAAIKKND